jgi:DNA primase catalytic core
LADVAAAPTTEHGRTPALCDQKVTQPGCPIQEERTADMIATATPNDRPRRNDPSTRSGQGKIDLHALKQSIDLLALVRSRGHEPRRHGTAKWKINCPFHEDKDASLIITPAKSLWQCFGCGKGGSGIDFLVFHDHMTTGQAIRVLAEQHPEWSRRSPEGAKADDPKPRTAAQQALLNKTAEFYHKTFQQSPEGREYLKARGLTDPALQETFRVGYANETIKDALPPDGDLIADLKAIGILNAEGREHFRDCVVFPIYDPAGTGNVLGMYGRKINGDSSSTDGSASGGKVRHLYLPGPHAGVFNHVCARSSKIILLTEGIIDTATLWQAGYKNTTALYGTNGLTEDHLKLFRDHQAETVFLVMDGDPAGQAAAAKLSDRLKGEGLDVFTVQLPDGEDPNDYFQKHTAEDFEKLLQAAQGKANAAAINPDLEPAAITPRPDGFSMTLKRRSYAVQLVETKPTRIRATVKALTADRNRFHIDTVDLFSARSRKTFIADVVALYSEEERIITGDMNRIVIEAEKSAAKPDQTGETKAIRLTEEDRKEGERFGKRKDLLSAIFQDIEKCGYIGERANSLAAYLCMTSRKMDDPLALLIVSGSGAGKSALQDTALALCPEEDLVKVTSLTERALFYKDELSLKHKVLAMEELAGAEDAAYAIRNLISSKVLIIESTIKDPLTGRLTTMENRVYGPTSVFQTTTRPDVDPETRSRFLVTTIDESREQTKRILEAQRKARTLEGFKRKIHRQNILKKHHAFQRLLRSLPVFNPFSELLTFTDERLLTRRDQPKYLQLMETIAFLRQMQKPVKQATEDGKAYDYIEVSLSDIALANELALEILGRSLDELSGPSRRLLLLIEALVSKLAKERKHEPGEALFTRRELREFTRWSDYQIHHYLNQLVALEYLVPVCGRNGQQYQYRLVWDGQGKEGERFVLGLKTVEQLRKDANLLGFSDHLLE